MKAQVSVNKNLIDFYSRTPLTPLTPEYEVVFMKPTSLCRIAAPCV